MSISLIFIAILFLSLLLESTVIGFPLVLVFSIILFLNDESKKTLVYIFFASFLLDAVRAETVGASALFIFTVLLLMDFYKRNFEVRDMKLMLLMNAIATIAYAKVFGYEIVFVILCSLIMFFVLLLFGRPVFSMK